ncbi:hypothetical protein G6F42_013132 [Rhizopus arrhizus]|nr:hypothetical protein G6F42_013132 [Rhizopus arrhizus]
MHYKASYSIISLSLSCPATSRNNYSEFGPEIVTVGGHSLERLHRYIAFSGSGVRQSATSSLLDVLVKSSTSREYSMQQQQQQHARTGSIPAYNANSFEINWSDSVYSETDYIIVDYVNHLSVDWTAHEPCFQADMA